MSALRTAVSIAWLLFWVYWLISASMAKQGSRTGRVRPPGAIVLVLVVVLPRVFKTSSLTVHDPALEALGAIVFASGLGLAVWARVHLGRNWGMPMTQKDEPELVTSGPYRYVRHPIYTGILVAVLGTSLVVDLYWLMALVLLGAYFVYSARVEERLMTDTFPGAYPNYRAHTKMLIPFLL
jgi:protein-S-isoprenylcysteine O-methyltransferase Ste14